MAKRAKYVPKNIGAYKLARKCHACDAEGVIVKNGRYSCIEHMNLRATGSGRAQAWKTPTEVATTFSAYKGTVISTL
jgi:hypothetical protein